MKLVATVHSFCNGRRPSLIAGFPGIDTNSPRFVFQQKQAIILCEHIIFYNFICKHKLPIMTSLLRSRFLLPSFSSFPSDLFFRHGSFYCLIITSLQIRTILIGIGVCRYYHIYFVYCNGIFLSFN